ncbi:MAG: oligosaccharide flippase family protein [Bacteroidota bacterium]
MIKKIFSFGIIEGLAKALNVGMMLLLPFIVSVDLYAEINLLISIQIIAVSVIIFGMDRAVLRFLKDHNKHVFWDSFISIWLRIVVIAIPLIIIGFLLWKGSTSYIYTAILLALLIVLQGIRQIKVAASRAMHVAKKFFVYRLLTQISIFTLVIVSLLIYPDPTIFLLAFCLAILPFVFQKINLTQLKLENKKALFEKIIFAFSWPLVFHTIGNTLLMSIDRIVLYEYLGKEDVAVYSLGYTFGASLTFIYAISNAYFEPKLIKIEGKLKDQREKILSSYTSIQIILAALAALLLVLITPYIITNFYEESYLKSLPIIVIVMLTHFLNPIYLQANFRLMNIKKTKFIAISSFLSGGFNLVLNIVFLEYGYGIMGAAYATFIAYLMLILITYVFSIVKSKTSFYMKDIMYLLGTVLVASFGLYYYESTLVVLSLTAGLIILHIFNIKEVRKIL